MNIDIENDQLIPIKDVPKHCPGRPHVSTVWRWVQRGIRGNRLETILWGGRRFCSREAIQRFVEATTGSADSEDETPAVNSNRRKKEIEQAMRECDLERI